MTYTGNLHKCFGGLPIINLDYVVNFYISDQFKYISKNTGWDGEVIHNDDLTKIEYTPMAILSTGEHVILGRSWDKKKNAIKTLNDIAYRKIDPIHGVRSDVFAGSGS